MEAQEKLERDMKLERINNMKDANKDFKSEQNIQFEQVLAAPIIKQEVDDRYNGMTE